MYASGNQNTFTGCVMKLSKGVLKKPDFIKEEVVTPATAQPALNCPSVTRSGFAFGTNAGSVKFGATSGHMFGNQVSATSISQRVVARPIPVFELSDDDD